MKYVFGRFSFQLIDTYVKRIILKLTEKIAKIDQETSRLFAYNHPFPNY